MSTFFFLKKKGKKKEKMKEKKMARPVGWLSFSCFGFCRILYRWSQHNVNRISNRDTVFCPFQEGSLSICPIIESKEQLRSIDSKMEERILTGTTRHAACFPCRFYRKQGVKRKIHIGDRTGMVQIRELPKVTRPSRVR